MQNRKGRADGEETKKRIFAAAAELFAQRGYHNTSAKDICSAAGVNAAAINYHFNGKDGLYEQVFSAAIEHFLHLDFLQALDESHATAQDKLDELIEHVVANILEERSWHGKVWAREIVTPSPMINTVLVNEAHTRASIIKKMVMEASDFNATDDDVTPVYALFTLLAPCMMLMIVNPELPTPIQPIFSRPQSELVAYIKSLVRNQYPAK